MALYTTLSPDELAAIALAYGLGAIAEAVGIPQGSINTNYRLETGRGRFFLRHTTVRGPEALGFEAALLDHLNQARFPSPSIERTRDGRAFLELEGGRVTLFHYLAGEELARGALTFEHLERLGEELGKLHRLTASFLGTRENPYGPEVVERWLRELAGHPDHELQKVAIELMTYLDAAYRRPPGLQPAGVIHADLFLDNVKWLGDRVSAIFDFEMACRDAYGLDLAITLNAWCFDREYSPPLCRALVSGYQRERALAPGEIEALHAHAIFGAVRFTASRIRDFHLSPLPPERLTRKDYRTYLARVHCLIEIGPSDFKRLLGLD